MYRYIDIYIYKYIAIDIDIYMCVCVCVCVCIDNKCDGNNDRVRESKGAREKEFSKIRLTVMVRRERGWVALMY